MPNVALMKHRRALITRMVLTILTKAHRARFPKERKLGPDLARVLVLYITTANADEGLPTIASKIAQYLELPRETTRRHLEDLMRWGLILRANGRYVPSPRMDVSPHENSLVALVKHTAAQL